MTDHERLIAAARASVVAARELGLPPDDPDLGIAHDVDAHIDRLERSYRKEREANRAMREAIVEHGGKLAIVVRLLVALVLVMALVGAVFFDRLTNLAQSNREAVRVSCTLLTNAILESGAGGSDQPARTRAARAQRDSTELYIGAIVRRLLTPAERKTLRENARVVAKAGGVISTPNCDAVAKHPERVRELVLGPSRDPARRSPAAP